MSGGCYEALNLRTKGALANRRIGPIWRKFYRDGELFWVENSECMSRWMCYWYFVVVYRERGGSPKSPDEIEYFEQFLEEARAEEREIISRTSSKTRVQREVRARGRSPFLCKKGDFLIIKEI